MRAFTVLAAAACVGMLAVGGAAAQAESDQTGVAGIWQGTLSAMGQELRIVFNVQAGAEGGYAVTLDSPDQGATGIPVDQVTVEGATVIFGVSSVAGTFRGTLADDGQSIAGEWSQGGVTFPLELARVAEAPKIVRPQEPVGTSPYRAENVSYQNAAAGITIGGTITIPSGDGPFPAVLLISGSGPQDRNETVFGHRPFLVTADNLTKRGIVVLRVDDRGVGSTQGDVSQSTSRDLADDVLAGVRFLKTRPEVDPKRIGLLGHSEGAIIAPMAAIDSHDVAFLVLLAAPGIVGEELLYDQASRIAAASGQTPEEIERNRTLQQGVFGVIKTQPDNMLASEELDKLFRAAIEALPEEERAELGDAVDAIVAAQIRSVISPWFRSFIVHDPQLVLARVECPTFVLYGEKDLQVAPDANVPWVEAALKDGGNSDHTVKTFKGLNHLFQTAETGLIDEYAKIQETMAPEVLALIGDWITERFGKR